MYDDNNIFSKIIKGQRDFTDILFEDARVRKSLSN
jgi:hypothetical protein